ncbi:hypothetical protein MKX03_031461 [Papaver bracteatum]|nr:hypothetical protein MKX03_031461 [Papaver bracteatum]
MSFIVSSDVHVASIPVEKGKNTRKVLQKKEVLPAPPIRFHLEIYEKSPTTIKNYSIWLRYQSRTGYHNMYKEYRDTTLNGGVEQMYTEMASRHRVRSPCIQIIKTGTIPAKLCKKESTNQFHKKDIKFPLVFQKVRETKMMYFILVKVAVVLRVNVDKPMTK